MADRTMRYVLQLVAGQYRSTMGQVIGQTKAANQNMAAMAGSAYILGTAMAAVGFTLTRAVSNVESAATKFEAELAKMQGLVGLTAEETDMLGQAALNLAHTGQGPQVLAEALYFISSAGHNASDSLDIVTHSAMAASAGLGDVQDVARLIGGIVNAYGKETIDAAHATDVLVNTVRLGAAEASEVANTIGRAIPVAAEMGVTFEDVGAAIALMTRNSTNSYIATTQLRGILSQILQPSKQAESTLKAYGFGFAAVRQEIEEKGLLAGLEKIRNAVGDNDAAIGRLFPNVRGLVGYLALMGGNIDKTRAVFDDMHHSTGRAKEAYDAWSKTAAAAHARFDATLEGFKVRAGTAILPVVKALLGGATKLVEVLSKVPAPLLAVGLGLMFLAGAALLLIPRFFMLNASLALMGVEGGIAAAGITALNIAMRLLPWVALTAAVGSAIGSIISWRNVVQEVHRDVAEIQAFQPDERSSVKAMESKLADAEQRLKELRKKDTSAGEWINELFSLDIVPTETDKAIDRTQEEIDQLREGIDHANTSADSFGKASSQAAKDFLVGLLGKGEEVEEIAMALRFFVISGRLTREEAIGVSYALKRMKDQGLLTSDTLKNLITTEGLAKLREAATSGGDFSSGLLDMVDPATKAALGIQELADETEAYKKKLQELSLITGLTLDQLRLLGEDGVDSFMELTKAAAKAGQTFLDTFGLVKNVELPPTAEEAAEKLADALDKVADAQERVSDIQDKLEENSRYLVRTHDREKEKEKALRDLEGAQRDLAKAEKEAAEARKKALSPSQAIEEEYKEQIKRSQQFLKDLNFAIQKGISPEFAYRAATNPEEYAPILAAIREDPSLINTINDSEAKLKDYAKRLEMTAFTLGSAMQAGLDQLDKNLKDKLSEMLSEASNVDAERDAYLLGYLLVSGLYEGMDAAHAERAGSAASGGGKGAFGPGLDAKGKPIKNFGQDNFGRMPGDPDYGADYPSLAARGGVLPTHHSGGYISHDETARLQGGEFVWSKDATRYIGANTLAALDKFLSTGNNPYNTNIGWWPNIYQKPYTPNMQSSSAAPIYNNKRGGDIHIGELRAHNYADFRRQVDRERRLRSLSGD